jgi:hypothetical protein
VAGDPRVQSTFEQAVAAVQREGGGAGGVAAAQLRDALYRIVAPGWQKMTQTYGVRQLPFHMGPGSTSFLRVHKPEKFGDNMDDLRHMVVDVYRDQQPRTGLELGRVYAGLRGIVPVYSAAVEDELIGVLEVAARGPGRKCNLAAPGRIADDRLRLLYRSDLVSAAGVDSACARPGRCCGVV